MPEWKESKGRRRGGNEVDRSGFPGSVIIRLTATPAGQKERRNGYRRGGTSTFARPLVLD